MIEVIHPGLETSVQDYPGRIGYWNQGFPPSGPMDSWSFRLANRLVGNDPGAPALECQFIGPTLRFDRDVVAAVCGADMRPALEGEAFPMWEGVRIRRGQTLKLGPSKRGARAYLALAGSLPLDPWLGSCSTFHKAGVGGINGHALVKGLRVAIGDGSGEPGRRVREECRPPIPDGKSWQIDVVRGPNDDWIDEAGHERFLATDWVLSSRSDRTGFRLDGPDWTFTEKALHKAPEHGSEPSNIIDQGYPVGAINLAGQTPIILVNDGPSMGGFINPYTVPSASFWKLGQSKPGHRYRFASISVEQAQERRRQLDRLCGEDSLE